MLMPIVLLFENVRARLVSVCLCLLLGIWHLPAVEIKGCQCYVEAANKQRLV